MNHPRYDIHPSVPHPQSIVANMARNTGATVEEWVRRVQSDGPADHRAVVGWLRSTHGPGGTTAHLVARVARDGIASIDGAAYLSGAPGWIEALYSGRRKTLAPIHDKIVALCLDLGRDVRFCPTRTMLPVYRNHVIAHGRSP